PSSDIYGRPFRSRPRHVGPSWEWPERKRRNPSTPSSSHAPFQTKQGSIVAATDPRSSLFHGRPDVLESGIDPVAMRSKGQDADADREPTGQERARQIDAFPRVDPLEQVPVEPVHAGAVQPLSNQPEGQDRQLRLGQDLDARDATELLGGVARQGELLL